MSPTDGELLARARADDRAAFAELVRRHHGAVRALLRRLTCGDHARADDLAQDTFVRAHRAIASFEERAKLSTWLCQIAYRVFLADIKRARAARLETVDEAEPEDRTRTSADAALLRHDVEHALARLSHAERDAIALTFGRDMTHEEAARILDCPLGTLKTNVARGLEKLERHMRPWSETA